MSLQRTHVHAGCSRYPRREPRPRARGPGPVAQAPRPGARAVVQTRSKCSLIGPKLADLGTWQIPGGSGRPWFRLSPLEYRDVFAPGANAKLAMLIPHLKEWPMHSSTKKANREAWPVLLLLRQRQISSGFSCTCSCRMLSGRREEDGRGDGTCSLQSTKSEQFCHLRVFCFSGDQCRSDSTQTLQDNSGAYTLRSDFGITSEAHSWRWA